ncbi:hydantoinase/oxoprolinase family protein [Umezawaea sp. Da 62-37]|uniref:hydantoinase/oxoprolinase family protein n=1 Tax=Umezawaea sp. Da 62-37 TaxID=3075927 RepID=UPI0028F6EE9D|nr:hydantoinase/oxoprolinase family protein [Umezawaea sp. Da 62-37]WNV87951.1 hydantoinase/oxoprolinase family protein [Umezawaea sp. Da 62-37]
MRIGIDVGGSHTDAVLVDGDRLLGTAKRPTSADIRTGIVEALSALVIGTGLRGDRVDAVVMGTTQFLNAAVTASELAPTAIVRFTIPAPHTLMPLVFWPERLVRAIGGTSYLCGGGHEFDGRDIMPFDRAAFRRIMEDIAARDIRAVALSSVFSPVNADVEVEAAEMLADRLPDVVVSRSSEIGQLGLLGRENATTLNAALRPLADRVLEGLVHVVRIFGIRAPVYLSQNDGTLMDVERARLYPIFTFSSGPVNSILGGGSLSGLDRCVVVDVGGSTTDIGVLHDGFPRLAVDEVSTAGLITNFRMPDILSIPVGGGSVVRLGPPVGAGPDTVASGLLRKARVFGGDTLTVTDVAAAAGLLDIGDPARVADLPDRDVRDVLDHVRARIAAEARVMCASTADVPIVAVGGAAFLVPDDLVPGREVVRPDHGHAANAVGAAMALVGSHVDRIAPVPTGGAADQVDRACQEAADRVVAAGADPGTVRIVEQDAQPVPYLPGNAVRIRVRAVGKLDGALRQEQPDAEWGPRAVAR